MSSITEMEDRIARLEMQISAERAKNANLQEYNAKAAKETQDILSQIRKFCNVILEKNISNGKTTSTAIQAMNIREILNAAEEAYRQEQAETQKIYAAFSSTFEEKNRKINQFQTLITQLQQKISRCTDVSNLDDPKKDPNVAQSAVAVTSTETPTETKQTVIPGDDFTKSVKVESAIEQLSEPVKTKMLKEQDEAKSSGTMNGLYGSKDLSKIEKDMQDIDWYVFEMVGTRGISEKPIIVNQLVETYNLTKTKLREAIKKEVTKSIFNEYRINTGLRWFDLMEFTPEGELLYKAHFGKDPVEPEISIVRKAHDNIIHGYGIKDTASALGQLGFSNITTDRKLNYIRIDDTHSSIPDIIAVKDGETYYFEYECGNHTYTDFDDKCHKLASITPTLYFVVPNAEVMDKVKNQISHWIESEGGIDPLRATNTKVLLTTTRQLVEGVWKYVFNMESDEPITDCLDEEANHKEE